MGGAYHPEEVEGSMLEMTDLDVFLSQRQAFRWGTDVLLHMVDHSECIYITILSVLAYDID